MNKKGFTLVELLAVVAVLAVIALVVISSVGDTVDNTKNQIAEINKNQIIDAAKVLGNELLFCDNSTTNFVLENTTCQKIKNGDYMAIVTIKQLYENGYLSNDINCDGELTINIDSKNYKVNVELSDYSCDGSSNPGSNTPGGNEEPERIRLSQAVIASVDKPGGTTNYGTAGYRYSGANPVNYITFNSETWRIIGVVDGSQIGKEAGTYYTKIIRNESIGNIQWNSKDSNTWYTSSLYNTLNVANDYTYKDNTNVEAVNWYHKASDSDVVLTSAQYTAEGWGTTCNASSKNCTSNAKVGLMSSSDYGYASSACYSSTNISSYNSSICTGSNWLYINNTTQWLLEPRASLIAYRDAAWIVYTDGQVDDGHYVTYSYAMRPVVYLKPSTTVSGGDGQSGDPYTIE